MSFDIILLFLLGAAVIITSVITHLEDKGRCQSRLWRILQVSGVIVMGVFLIHDCLGELFTKENVWVLEYIGYGGIGLMFCLLTGVAVWRILE